jgi:hypothetical protein
MMSVGRVGDGQPDGPRYFRDGDGQRWAVAEEPTPRGEWSSADRETHRSGYPVGWLSFVCGTLRKRLRLFPAEWRTLSDAELDRLCRRAREFQGRE